MFCFSIEASKIDSKGLELILSCLFVIEYNSFYLSDLKLIFAVFASRIDF